MTGPSNVAVLSAQYLLWSVGVYGLVFWLPSIVKHLTGHGIGTTGLLTAIPYAAAVIAMIAVSTAWDRRADRRVFTWIPLLISALCFAVSYLTRGGTFTTAFILLIIAAASMYAPYGPYFAYAPELLPAADAAPAIGMINAFGALGGFADTYIAGALGGGTSAVPFMFLAACLFAAALLVFAGQGTARSGQPAVGPAQRHTQPAHCSSFAIRERAHYRSVHRQLAPTRQRASGPHSDHASLALLSSLAAVRVHRGAQQPGAGAGSRRLGRTRNGQDARV